MTKQFCDKCESEILENSRRGYIKHYSYSGEMFIDSMMSKADLCEGCYNEMFFFVKK